MPKVSVIMSTYNNANFLPKAIKSVLLQSFFDFEFIIINDNSTDNTEDTIKNFSDERIVYLKNEENKGLIFNLNKGLEIARGEYIARIDSDDCWSDKDKLQKQVNFLEQNPDFALVGTWAQVYDKDGIKKYQIKYFSDFDQIKKKILFKNCFVHSSVVFRKNCAKECGGYNVEEKYIEDYGLWLRMGEKYKLGNIAEICADYLHNESGETQKNNLQQIYIQ